MKNHETTLKNHGNQPKTIKTIVLRYVTNTGSKLTTMIKKRDVTNTGPQPTSFGAKNVTLLTQGPQPTSFGAKNVTLLTRGPNRPPLVQKKLRDEQGATTDLLWCKNIT